MKTFVKRFTPIKEMLNSSKKKNRVTVIVELLY